MSTRNSSTTPDVPRVTANHVPLGDNRGYSHAVAVHRTDLAPEIVATFTTYAAAERLAAELRGALADAYSAGRADQRREHDAARELDAIAAERRRAHQEHEHDATGHDKATRRYLVTVRDVGNITDDPRNIHTILTSRDMIAPRDRVTVEVAP